MPTLSEEKKKRKTFATVFLDTLFTEKEFKNVSDFELRYCLFNEQVNCN